MAACQGLLRMAQYNDQDLAYIVSQVRRVSTANVTQS